LESIEAEDYYRATGYQFLPWSKMTCERVNV